MNFNYVKIMSTPNKETEQIDSPKERKSHFYLTVTPVPLLMKENTFGWKFDFY